MKLNQKPSISAAINSEPTLTKNYEGGIAFKMDAKLRLYSRIASCLMGEPKFYHEKDEQGNETDKNQDKLMLADIQEVAATDPKFILQLADYARNTLNLRTVSVVTLVEASLIAGCKPFVRKYTPMVVQRADELAEAVAYLQSRIGHIGSKAPKGSMPWGLKKGLADAFHNFNEYELAKYNRGSQVKLKDVLKLVHPKPRNEEESALFKRLKEDSLATPETWETYISTKGSTKENWEHITPKMPYMALMRNLRSLLEKKVDATIIAAAAERLQNPALVKKNRQFPYRYLSAYRELQEVGSPYASKLLDALEAAIDASIANLPHLTGTTFITADISGSMEATVSSKSKVTRHDISTLLMSIASKICDFSVCSVFASQFGVCNFSARNGTIANMSSIRNGVYGGSTDAWRVTNYLNDEKLKADRIILFSDMQCYDSENDYGNARSFVEGFKRYKATVNPGVYLYSVDLAGYGTLQVPQNEPRTCLIAGWSERILEYINLFEQDGKSVVERISISKGE